MAGFSDNQFDLAIVDPPYGINFAKTHTGKGWIVRDDKEWDKEIPKPKYYKELFRVSKNQIIWGANYMVENIPPSMGWIFWDKGQRNFSLADGELAFTSFNRALRVFDMPRGSHKAQDDKTGGKIHPTQKPIKLYEWILINYAKEGDKILDTHLGSGSIAIACHNLGYNLTGYEIDTEYYEAAIKRLKQHQAQLRMF
ncbi:MAG: putative modification methylase [Prokaryotic dsDNA virus sp.]|nr:MAG: putative modification methylase [Prokaryotic dsDNA virus sp.]